MKKKSKHVLIRLSIIIAVLPTISCSQFIQGVSAYAEMYNRSMDKVVSQRNDDPDSITFKSDITVKEIQPSFGLTVQLISERNTYLPGETVVFKLRAQNRTSSPVLIHKAFDVRDGMIWPEVAGEDGIYRTYIGPQYSIACGDIRPSPMKPGEKITMPFSILYHVVTKTADDLPTSYAFSRPGIYLLRVKLYRIVPDKTFYTESVKIEIVAPTGADATVWKLLQTEDAAYFLHTGCSLIHNDIGIMKEFEQIIARYPDSAYTPYMQRSVNIFRSMKKRKGLLRQADVRLVNIKDRTFMLRTRSGNIRPGKSDMMKDTDAILKLADLWLQAYNANDIPRMFQYISRKLTVRQKWERASDRVRQRLVRRFTEYFSERGVASLAIVRITHEQDTVTADVTVTFEQKEANPFKKMKFVKDDDGIWRVHTGF